MPFPVAFGELVGYYVAGNTCESHIALPPLLETKVKLVVLNPLYATNIVLFHGQLLYSTSQFEVKDFHAQ